MRHNTIISTKALHFGLWNFALFENTLDRSNCCGLVFSKGLLSVHLWPFFPDLDQNFTISHSQKCENSQLAKLPQNVKNVSNCCGPVFEKKKKKKECVNGSNEQFDRSLDPVLGVSSSRYFLWNLLVHSV